MAVVALAAWWLATPGAAMPPVSPIGDQPVYQIVDEARVAIIEPTLRAPWTAGPPLAPVVAPPLILFAAALAAHAAGAGTLATLASTSTLALDPSFGETMAHAGPLAVALGFVWLIAVLQGQRWPARERLATLAIVAWAGAVWSHWLAVCAAPMVLALAWGIPHRGRRALAVSMTLVAGVLAFVGSMAAVAAAAERLSWAPEVTLSWRDALAVAFETRPRLPAQAFVDADLASRGSSLALALAVVGLATGTFARGTRRAGVMTTTIVLGVALLWPEWQAEALRLARWAIMPLVGLGLTFAARQAGSPRRARVAAATFGVVLMTESWVHGVRPLGGTEARAFRDQLVSALEETAGDRAALWVAEDTRLDSAVGAWVDGRQWRRVPQDRAIVDAAIVEGRRVVAGPTGRRHLELMGVRFRDAFVLGPPIPFGGSVVADTYRCATIRGDRWSQLPGVDYTGRLGVLVPPGLGDLELVVGDDLPLRLRGATADGRDVPLEVEPLMRGPGGGTPPPDFWLEIGVPGNVPREVARVRLPGHPTRGSLFSLHLGRRAPRVIARLTGGSPSARAQICAAPVGPVLAEDEASIALSGEDRLGTGWYGFERDGDGGHRWTGADAVLLVRAPRREAVTIEIDAEPAVAVEPSRADAAGRSGTDIALHVNGVPLGAHPMTTGLATYAWPVPAGIWMADTNEIWWTVSRDLRPADAGGSDTRRLAMRVRAVRVRR